LLNEIATYPTNDLNIESITMKSTFATIATAFALTAGFASVSASANEAPEFRSNASTLTRSQVSSAILGASAIGEATVIPTAKSTLTRAEVAKQAQELNKLGPRGINELAASNLN
jgi:hypothetical protein